MHVPKVIARQIILSNLQKRFRRVLWNPPSDPNFNPVVWFANHHSWHDGFLVYASLDKCGREGVDLVTDPLAARIFGRAGAIHAPESDATARGLNFRKCLREMQAGKVLVIFPEGELHRPPLVEKIRPGLVRIAKWEPRTAFQPIGIRVEMSMHERPEAWINFGKAIPASRISNEVAGSALENLISFSTEEACQDSQNWKILVEGSKSAHE